MKRSLISLLALALLASGLQAQTATQNLRLDNGWQAVWLEVEPRYKQGDSYLNEPSPLAAGDLRIGEPKQPQDVFTDPKITVVTSPKPLAGLKEFFGDSTSGPENPNGIDGGSQFNQGGWEIWNRDGGLGNDNLVTVTGNRGYLVKVVGASAPFALPVEGGARFFRPTWTPDRYNLVGFGIEGTIFFSDFFAPVAATHPVGRIFKLTAAGNWMLVGLGDPVEDGVAYWIFCNGTSRYMGPIAVDFDRALTGTLGFGGPNDAVVVNPDTIMPLDLDLEEVTFTNQGSAAATPRLELITPDPLAGASDLALHVVNPVPNTLQYVTGNSIDSVPRDGMSASLGESVNPQSSAVLTIGAARKWTNAPLSRTNLYRLTTGTPGTKLWLPISARRSDVLRNEDTAPLGEAGTVAGLWVGEVSIDQVTSVVEDGAPERQSAGRAPIRIILHSDTVGKVSLLNQVTVMQTRTADLGVDPVPVLVVDPKRIPFFEGVKERNGKRVGLRIQAVAYDMPRDISITAQEKDPDDPAEANDDDLLDLIVAESTSSSTRWLNGINRYPDRGDITEAAIQSYLLFSALRPPQLKEAYQLRLLLDGALGADKTVKTIADTLTLDPFHRTNPFRHALHQRHARGPQVTRELSILFDSGQTLTDRLRGTYTETIEGLTKSRIELSGRLELRRISGVATLEGLNLAP